MYKHMGEWTDTWEANVKPLYPTTDMWRGIKSENSNQTGGISLSLPYLHVQSFLFAHATRYLITRNQSNTFSSEHQLQLYFTTFCYMLQIPGIYEKPFS